MNPPASLRTRAFTLVELIVVISIIVLIATFVVPSVPSILRGSQMTQAAQVLTDQFNYARQQALAKNHAVEVRLVLFADPESPGQNRDKPETGHFRAIQIMDIGENGVPVPLGKVQRLPGTIVMSDKPDFSTLIPEPSSESKRLFDPAPHDPELPRGVAKHYKYTKFRFLPDGSTDLSPSENWFLTLFQETDMQKVQTATDIRKVNYFTLQVDPVNGSTREFRPTAG